MTTKPASRSVGTLRRKPRKRADKQPMCVANKCRRARYEDKLCAKHLADKRFAEHIRSIGFCVIGQSQADEIRCNGGLQCAHYISRRYGSLRWDESNATASCAAHHKYYTEHPLEWIGWLEAMGVPFDELRRRALNDPPQSPVEVLERGWAAHPEDEEG